MWTGREKQVDHKITAAITKTGDGDLSVCIDEALTDCAYLRAEVWSWQDSVASQFKQFEQKYAHRFSLHYTTWTTTLKSLASLTGSGTSS